MTDPNITTIPIEALELIINLLDISDINCLTRCCWHLYRSINIHNNLELRILRNDKHNYSMYYHLKGDTSRKYGKCLHVSSYYVQILNYKNNKQHGLQEHYEYSHNEAQLTLVRRSRYLNGNLDGLLIIYGRLGSPLQYHNNNKHYKPIILSIDNYLNGKLNGICYKFDNSGKLYKVSNFENDRLRGCQIEYKSDSYLMYNYVYGFLEGPYLNLKTNTEYEIGIYQYGVLHGISLERKNNIYKYKQFINGDLISVKIFKESVGNIDSSISNNISNLASSNISNSISSNISDSISSNISDSISSISNSISSNISDLVSDNISDLPIAITSLMNKKQMKIVRHQLCELKKFEPNKCCNNNFILLEERQYINNEFSQTTKYASNKISEIHIGYKKVNNGYIRNGICFLYSQHGKIDRIIKYIDGYPNKYF